MIAVLLNDGRVLNGSATASGTLITIPANSTFTGDAFISCGMTGVGTGRPRITVSGAGASPSDGSIIHQVTVAGLLNVASASSGTIEIIVKTGANPVTLEFNTGSASAASAIVNGFLV